MSRYYITTPLYYVNDRPHIGTAYSTITADVLCRYHRLFGDECLFLTGTDEHGQKCAQAAAARGLTPQQHCDDMVQNFQLAWRELGVSYDIFFRTTDEFHVQAVQQSLQSLFDAGEIYAAEYEGWYSISEEIFFTDKEVIDGKSPSGREVTRIKEKNYFFKMSKYQDALIAHIEKNPQFIQPDSRRNEVLGFLKQPLSDLCISRPKSRVSWGIEIPFDRDYVTYVWFDALLNYATAVGYQQPQRQKEFEKWWTATGAGAHHLIGKDILTTHSVYWTTMLMALKVALPKQIFAHGWILNRDNNKMSKSQGEVVRPLEMKDIVGAEPLRYFLIRDVHLGNDAPFSQELVVQRVNSDLANNLGNLLSRSANLIEKFYGGRFPAWGADDESSRRLAQQAERLGQTVRMAIEQMQPHLALESIMTVLSEANKYLEEKAPWKTAKTDLVQAGHVLATATEVVRICAILLSPVLPVKMAELLDRLSVPKADFHQAQTFRQIPAGATIRKGEPLFPRIE
jgi:methionyl-tRNA synthetase